MIKENFAELILKSQYSRFLDEYEKEGIHFWGITTGNEPVNGILPVNKFNSMGWTPGTQRLWIKEYLGPALKKFHPHVLLIALDDQRFMLPWWIDIVSHTIDVYVEHAHILITI